MNDRIVVTHEAQTDGISYVFEKRIENPTKMDIDTAIKELVELRSDRVLTIENKQEFAPIFEGIKVVDYVPSGPKKVTFTYHGG